MSAPPIAKSYAWVPGAMLALPTILTLPGAVHAGIVRRSSGLCVARPGARLTQLGRPDCRQWPYCPMVPDGTKMSTGIRASSPSRLASLARHEDLSAQLSAEPLATND